MIKILDFYADWCGPCKAMTPIIEELKTEYKDQVEFETVDVEAQSELAGQYGIMSIPTFVILKEGKEVDRKVAATPKAIMKEWIDGHLK